MRHHKGRWVLAAAAATSLVAGCSAEQQTAAPTAEASAAGARDVNGQSSGSRAYMVDSIGALVSHSDLVAVGRVGDSVSQEAADEESKSGLKLLTYPFTVSKPLKGSTDAQTISLSILPLGTMKDEIALVEPGKTYVVFMEKNTLRGEVRYSPVGGVGVYEVKTDGSLGRIEKAPDKFPQSVASVASLEKAMANPGHS